ncbi:MAG: hypothetical protein AAGH89_15975 [Verrucomicrobiota bacterium]
MKSWIFALLVAPFLCSAETLLEPFKIVADGKPIDTRGNMTYAGPLVGDLTGDGVEDLAVTTITGIFLVYENVREEASGDPVYRRAEDLPDEKVPPKLQNW